ncbi:tripartite tricarboxylate transporter substrate binding protein [Aquabacterium sp. J223]|uniref:Bug family tripartite tricarboxylate transporter substrate binding protein n=1 Tax=Aquabacterium sp. J223 TaxID=2898431 RepID=UPI0021AE1E99|nr:tripartite tricarboxylate transporter substrate binding protein [Aquabacterium sp. J223]UUX95317.1 tripartite tricarboxylate transporter substrate binding protein [Aquabacterium sp. J223]
MAYPAGGGLDVMTRVVAEDMAKRLQQPIVVDNRSGAGGTLGTASVAKSPADGYTVMTIDMGGYTTAQHLYAGLSYLPPRDLQVVGTWAMLPFMLAVNANLPVKNYQEFVAHARAHPGKLNYGTSGVGNPLHISMELLQQRTGTKLVHVPYKAMVNMVADLASGEVQAAIGDYGSFKPFVQSGKVRLLAVATDSRLPHIPDVPTFSELGVKDYPISVWLALATPKGVPQQVVDRLTAALAETLQTQEVKDKFATFGVVPFFSSGPKAADFVRSQVTFWEGVVKPMNIRLD